jgi:hypothetical protein
MYSLLVFTCPRPEVDLVGDEGPGVCSSGNDEENLLGDVRRTFGGNKADEVIRREAGRLGD